MIKSQYTASQIIDEALFGIGDVDRRYFDKAVMYFMRGFRDFSLYHNEAVTVSWEPITAANTVNFPSDLIRLLWVGCSVNGELFSFTKSNRIISPVTAPLDDVLDATRGEDEGIVRSPESGYGAKGVNVEYYYNVDMSKNRIVLKRAAHDIVRFSDRSEVLIGYVSSGVTQLDKTYIYADAANMLIAFIEWKLMEYKSVIGKVSQSIVAMKEQNYWNAVRMYDVLNLPSLDELIDCIYESSGQNVRR